MPKTYPLHELNCYEFQELAATVLEHEYKIPIQTFVPKGPDKGIDGRGTTADNKKVVLQAKHTSDPNGKLAGKLDSFVKAESEKVKRLVQDGTCHIYYGVTNYSVTAGQNDKFRKKFMEFGVEEAVLIGKDTLDRWISGMPTKQLMKFPCLCSNKKEYRSEKLKENYKKEIKTFKQTESLTKAERKLEEKKYVFLLGEEKNGKTSMMKQLALTSAKDEDTLMLTTQASIFRDNVDEKSFIFMVDDIFGKLQINIQETENWDKIFEHDITDWSIYLMCNKIIITSRNQIYEEVKHKLSENFHKFLENNLIDLSQDKDLQNKILPGA